MEARSLRSSSDPTTVQHWPGQLRSEVHAQCLKNLTSHVGIASESTVIKMAQAGKTSFLYFLSVPSACGTVLISFRIGFHLTCQLTLRSSLETLSQTCRSVLCQFSRWSRFIPFDSQDQPSPSVPSPLSLVVEPGWFAITLVLGSWNSR